MSELYTSSRLKVFRECMRKHFYQYRLGIRTPSSPAAEFGTVAHSALEAYFLAWKRGDMDARLPDALAAIDRSALSPDNQVRLRAMIVAYHHRWHSEPWEILDVEVQFRYELGGFEIGGKVDAIIRDTRDGRVFVLEHKSTGQDASAGSGYWDRLSIDTQVSIYVDGATMLGHEIAGVIYDVIQRPRHELKLATPVSDREYTLGKGCSKCGGSGGGKNGIKQGRGHYDVVFASEVKRNECDGCAGTGWKLNKDGKPEAPRLYSNQRDTDETLDEFADRLVDEIAAKPDDFLIRGVVVRLEDELPSMRTDLLEVIRMEQAAALFEIRPRNPDNCNKFNSQCVFFDVCAHRASIDDEVRFPRSGAHPELATAA